MTDYNELVRCGECKFWSETEKGVGRCLKSGFKTPKDFLGEDGERNGQGMTDYTELVRSLRNCSNNRCTPCDCGWFDKYQVNESCKEIIMWKAADAIEALQAELPKRGEWLIHSTGGSMAQKKCPFCGSESWQSKEYAKVPKYCQNCGAHLPTFNIVDWVDYLYAKTEVQE